MSKSMTMRQALAASIVAADIGWTAESIIIRRRKNFWNDVATSISASKLGYVLHIDVADGASAEDEELEIDMSIPLTILCPPQVDEDAQPEEDLWEDLVTHVHGLRLGHDHHAWRFIFKSFVDIEVEADDGTEYLGRQTVFTKRLSL